MRAIALAALLAAPLAAQTVLPPGSATTEGHGLDGDVWTYRNGRATNRYPASWLNNPCIVTRVAWRGDATYDWTYDRPTNGPQTPCAITLRVGMWNGQQTNAWNPNLTTAFQGNIDPPQVSVTQAWTPQPFTFVIPLTTPVAIGHAGLEIDVAFAGPWDPVFGNRTAYYVDAAVGQQPTLADMWLDPVYPYYGCAGWPSETRTNRVFGHLTMETRNTGLSSAPAVLAIGTSVQYLGCAHIAGLIFLPAVTDVGGWLQIHVPQPTTDFVWTWQSWALDATKPVDQCFASGHACAWRMNSPWPCQLAYAYDDQAAQPSYVLPGTAWVVEVK